MPIYIMSLFRLPGCKEQIGEDSEEFFKGGGNQTGKSIQLIGILCVWLRRMVSWALEAFLMLTALWWENGYGDLQRRRNPFGKKSSS